MQIALRFKSELRYDNNFGGEILPLQQVLGWQTCGGGIYNPYRRNSGTSYYKKIELD